MYLGKNYPELMDNIKPLYNTHLDDNVIVATNKKLWLLSLKKAAYIKHHVARIHPGELHMGLTEEKRSEIYFGIKRLYKKGVL